MIFERLSPSGQKYKDATLRNLEDFAQSGLRTLCFAMADISESKYKVMCCVDFSINLHGKRK